MRRKAKRRTAMLSALVALTLLIPGTSVFAEEDASTASVVEEVVEGAESEADTASESEDTTAASSDETKSESTPAERTKSENTESNSDVAESEENESEADVLYAKFMACKTQEAFDSLMENTSDAEFNAMTEKQITLVMEYYMEDLVPVEPAVELSDDDADEPVESEYYSGTVNYSAAAPLKDPVQG